MPPPQIYSDSYNNYQQPYAPTAPYASYDYSMQGQAQPPFNPYPNQGVMQPVPPGYLRNSYDNL